MNLQVRPEAPPAADPSEVRRNLRSVRSTSGSDVEQMLQVVLAEGKSTSDSLGAGYQRLWRSLTTATAGGKRFRPALFVVAYRAWGGADDVSAAHVGVAVELLHTAFVVHDDVIDGDDVRRGRLNVSGEHKAQAVAVGVDSERARQYGVAAGVLAGDLALAAALRTVASCPAAPVTVSRLLDLFDDTLHTTAAGELADVWMSLGTEAPALEEALLMAERKTGEYSFALPLQAAAVLAGAPAAAVPVAGEVGRRLGVAYQLMDDVHGVFGDPRQTGKSSLSDLRSGKRTPLMAYARTTASWPEMAPHVGCPTITQSQADLVRGLLERSGSRRFVESLVSDYVDGALERARISAMPPDLVTWIAGMRTDLLGRAA